MKKRLLSAALILLLLLLTLPQAFADSIYPAPEAVQVGQPLDHLVATVAPGSQVSGSLPDGLELTVEEQAQESNVYLRGVLSAAGTYDCIININNTSFSCPVTVTPEPPTVAVSADIRCYPGDAVQISISASVSDGGNLSYQWYRSLTSTDRGEPVDGAMGDSLTVSTQEIGTLYYRCLVANSGGGLFASTLSSPIAVTVEELSVSAISVEAMPERTEYTVGDTLETAGLCIRAELANGNTRILMEGFGVYPTRLDEAGTQSIEVSYQGKTCSFTVNVQQDEEAIEGIGVLTMPVKTSYVVGDTLETRGLSIRVYTDSGHRDVSEGLSCSPTRLDTAGPQRITVSYGGKTCTFTVQVSQSSAPASLSVSKLPAKLQYTVGDTLDTTGLVIRQVSNNNEILDINTGYTCSPTVLDTAGHQEITVYYGDLSCHFNVTVLQAAAATPVPTPSPMPAPTPSPTPDAPTRQVSAPVATAAAVNIQHAGGSAKTLFTVVIVTAAAALAVLGGYVFVMNRGGFDQAVASAKELIQRFRKR